MSASTKKKHVFLETINNYSLPNENQTIVKVKAPRGNNLHDVESPSGELFIVTMPVKFRKSVWTKRGDFLIVESIEEGNKVKAEIIHILTKDHIRYLKSQGVWPKEFENIDDEKQTDYISKDMLPSSSDEELEGQEGEEEEEKEDNQNQQKSENNVVNFNRKRLNQNELF